MELFNFNTAYTQLRELYGIELQPDEFESMGLIAWSKIGNKLMKLEEKTIEIKDMVVDIPCDAHEIEAVFINQPDYQNTSNQANSPLIYPQFIEQYINMRRGDNVSPFYKDGKLIKYSIIGPHKIQVGVKTGYVNVLYQTLQNDEQGLPLINVKEIDAIAAYCAYATTFKQSIQTRDQSTFQMTQFLELKWKDLCSHARTPMYLTQNDFDAIGDVKYSWDRKSYGKTFKPIK